MQLVDLCYALWKQNTTNTVHNKTLDDLETRASQEKEENLREISSLNYLSDISYIRKSFFRDMTPLNIIFHLSGLHVWRRRGH